MVFAHPKIEKNPPKPKGILKKAGPPFSIPQEHLQWDEDNIALTEIEKDSLMKITEPKTPYVRYNADTDEIEGEIPPFYLSGLTSSPASSPRPISPTSVVASGPPSRRASLSSLGKNSSGRSPSVASSRSTSFSLPNEVLRRPGTDNPRDEVEEMDEEAAAKHAAFVRARGRHYSNEAEAMKKAAQMEEMDDEEEANTVNGITHHPSA